MHRGRSSWAVFGLFLLTLGTMFEATAQSYDRWSIDKAHEHMNQAFNLMLQNGWRPCSNTPAVCRQAEWHLSQANEHIINVFNAVIAANDAQGRPCLLTDPWPAYRAAERLKNDGAGLRRYGGTYYYWGYSANTISGWLNDPYCAANVPQPQPSPSPAPQPAPSPPPRPQPVTPGPERCNDRSIPVDAHLAGYARGYGGGHTSIPMKGEFACKGPGAYWRVTRSEITQYQCDSDYRNCRQTKVIPVQRAEVLENKTTYWVSDSAWWVKQLVQ